jgi:hypothetical protein
MKLKLTDGKVEIVQMKVSELINHTYLEYEFEADTAHLHPTLTINGKRFKEQSTFIEMPDIKTPTVDIKVELFDDNNTLIHVYESSLAYNKYQITGEKPIRPDIEAYIFLLEKRIRDLIDEYELKLLELENKGEVV